MTQLLLLHPLTYPQDSHTPAFETAPIPRRLTLLIESYLSVDILNDRLQDLSQQFQHPQPRPWQPIDWDSINPSQIRGIDPLIF